MPQIGDDAASGGSLHRKGKKRLSEENPAPAAGSGGFAEAAASGTTSLRWAYRKSLSRGEYPERFLRNFHALSIEDQDRLLNSSVAVVGLGGLGGTTVEILARIGVGSLTLIDGDRFEESNLNRQLLSSLESIGRKKAAEAARRVRAVNPSVELTVIDAFFDRTGADRLLGGADVIVDCLDSISVRFELEAAARAAQKPLISAAVAGAAGHVTTVFPEDAGLASIYGENGSGADKGSEAELGCLPQAVLLLASVEASEVVNVLLGKTRLLRNRLLLVDLFDNLFEVMQLG